jgi:hypothetical protein
MIILGTAGCVLIEGAGGVEQAERRRARKRKEKSLCI